MHGADFSIVRGPTVAEIIAKSRGKIYDAVKNAYKQFGNGEAENPNSLFLTFKKRDPASPNRIIALPAYSSSPSPVGGMKWISSFPGNLEKGLPRASAVVVLNDLSTGYPYACIEGSHISAARTAASAALGAELLFNGTRRARQIGFVGTGVIAQSIHAFLSDLGWEFDAVCAYDQQRDQMSSFQEKLSLSHGTNAQLMTTAEQLIEACDLVVFATTASVPHVHNMTSLNHNPRILHISLRDLDPSIINASYNLVDDREHCLKAKTSVHLAAEANENADSVVDANVYDRIADDGSLVGTTPDDRPAIYSPFGMGILDIAVADLVFREAQRVNAATRIGGFFS